MKFDSYEYQIGAHFLSALINEDFTGLSTNEAAAFAGWQAEVLQTAGTRGHWAMVDDSADEFGRCDITGSRGATEKVAYMFPVAETTT